MFHMHTFTCDFLFPMTFCFANNSYYLFISHYSHEHVVHMHSLQDITTVKFPFMCFSTWAHITHIWKTHEFMTLLCFFLNNVLMSRKLVRDWRLDFCCKGLESFCCSVLQSSLPLKDELSFRSKCVLWSRVGGWKEDSVDCTRFSSSLFPWGSRHG